MRLVYLVLGMVFMALGLIGALVPVLPTVPFLIVATACFARSSPRLESWLLDLPRFGPTLRKWRERGAITMKAKLMSLFGMSIGFALFWLGAKPTPILTLTVASIMLMGVAYVFSRPSS
jgi:uncharacterized protein